ncbi:NUDIX domain-containing protein [Streptomyces sp. SBT349]|uniref:NUDIX domain-containing protein n=1 Tax=Streptomyces sp. SBT349 TaxID=1580539 RepID=UPI00066D1EAF|nr:NUDIX domain-containing protein [Streptomyces sp. SBT349]
MPSPPPPAAASLTQLVAAVLVHDLETDRVVLLRRSPDAPFGGGLWDLPVGKCDPGEPITATAVRELKEETGLLVDPADLALVHVLHGARGARAPGGFLTVIFRTHRWRGTLLNAEPHKHSQARWVGTGELPEEMVFSTDRVIHRCLTGEPGVTLHGWS